MKASALSMSLWMVAGAASVAGPASVAAAQGQEDLSDEEQRARVHFRAGTNYYELGRFHEAAREFEEAYALSERPELLYNLYLTYRDLNDTERAAGALRRYLEAVPDLASREKLQSRLDALEEALARREASPDKEEAPLEPATIPAGAPDAPDGEEDPPGSQRALRSTGYIVASVGAAMLVGSMVTGIMTRRTQKDLEALCPDRDCTGSPAASTEGRDLASRGRTLSRTTDALLFSGLAVAVTGGLLWLLSRKGNRSDEAEGPPTVGVGCLPTGCTATVRGRF